MSLDETITEVSRLLKLLSGVDIVWTQQSPDCIRIGLQVNSMPSLAVLGYVSREANVLLDVEVDWIEYWPWDGSQTDPSIIRYDLRAQSERNLELVGIELLRHFKKKELLNSQEIDRLLTMWNARLV